MSTTYNRIDENRNKTILFISVFIASLFLVVYIVDLLFFENHFVSGVFLLSLLIVSLGDFIYSEKLILKENRAQPFDYEKNKEIYKIVDNLCRTVGMKIPSLYVINEKAINAFTVGRNPKRASLVFTQGMLEKLNREEVEGVIAHELAHIKNNDVALYTSLAFLLGFVRSVVDLAKKFIDILVSFMSSDSSSESLIKMFFLSFAYAVILSILLLILFLSLIPVIEELIFYKISRKREFLADAEGVLMTRYPMGMVRALEKIAADNVPLKTANSSTAHLYISSPFKDDLNKFWRSLFHSHPPIEKRIEILKKMDEYGKISYNTN